MTELATGNCFEISALMVVGGYGAMFESESRRGVEVMDGLGADDRMLAHGTVTRFTDGREHEHGWVEAMGLAFDFSNGNEAVAPLDEYYAAGKIKDVKHYTPAETRAALLSAMHYGPWD